MLLRSTVCNFVKDLPPERREHYLAVVKSVPVQRIKLEARDKVNTVMNGTTKLKVLDEAELEQALVANALNVQIATIKQRAFMITPVGELGAFANYQSRPCDKNSDDRRSGAE
jgi:hypothetical protein